MFWSVSSECSCSVIVWARTDPFIHYLSSLKKISRKSCLCGLNQITRIFDDVRSYFHSLGLRLSMHGAYFRILCLPCVGPVCYGRAIRGSKLYWYPGTSNFISYTWISILLLLVDPGGPAPYPFIDLFIALVNILLSFYLHQCHKTTCFICWECFSDVHLPLMSRQWFDFLSCSLRCGFRHYHGTLFKYLYLSFSTIIK